ncbi:MAG TPA: class I SAM-dependent methyltransferase [Candidatus Paceibacterota bacterium]|nr:class I SAM-dependent methyltransferase [Candidatus Paceibacterota bacterium]
MDPRLLRFYTDHIQRFGTHDPRALGWRNDASQLDRFSVLTEIADLTNASILDEGCGFGDLYPFLKSRFSGIQYSAVDINQTAIATAQERYPEVSFEVADFSDYTEGPFDYVLSSGALTFNMDNAVPTYQAHMRKMYDLCIKGVAFNVLDRKAVTQTDEYLGWDPEETEAYCNTFAEKVIVRHDYSLEDFTVYLYR